MKKGQAFTPASLVKEGTRLDVIRSIPEGMRVVSLPLSHNSGLDSLLYPGCIVDVVASFKLPAREGGSSESVANILIEAAKVLAIGDRTIASGEDEADVEKGTLYRQTNVALLVEAWQSKPLQLAKQNGTISLAMRHPRDTSHISGSATNLRQMIDEGVPSTLRWASPSSYGGPADASSQPSGTNPGSFKASTDTDYGQWETVIIRAGQVERKVFPISQAKEDQQNKE